MKKQLPAWLALCIISLVAGLLLALTNHLTVDRIAEQGAAKANAARQSVMQGAESFTLLELNPEWLKDCGVDDCYECRDGEGALTGYTSQITVKGYGGAIEVVTGMDTAGAITGIDVGGSGFAETAGLGAKVKDAAFTGQFAGKAVPLALKEDIDSITGASISSGAVVGGVNKAATYMMYQAGLAQPEENPLEGAFEVRTAEAQGFAGPVFLQVGVDESGAITGIKAGDERFAETSGLGDRVKEKVFRDQFLGKSGPLSYGEDIEAIAGATVTSDAFMAALNEALGTAAEEPAVEPEEAVEEVAEETAEEPAAEPVEEVAEASDAESLSASGQGFGGPVEVTITLNADGTIASLEVGGEGFAETPGLGTNVQEPAFTDQFIGKKGPFAFGEGVEAVAGATVTSNAALDALNSLFAAEEAADIAAEPVEEVAEEAAGGPEEATEAPAAEPLSASSQGFGGPVEVIITLNADGTIASLEIGGEGFAETPGIGTNVQEPAFTDQFVGKKGPFAFGEGVEAVTGATVSSNAALDALNSLFAAE
ncbi:MAG: FMN-binding protein [Bacillota bacterium]|nr:FMN-binding protein [Bacillota bacterium]